MCRKRAVPVSKGGKFYDTLLSLFSVNASCLSLESGQAPSRHSIRIGASFGYPSGSHGANVQQKPHYFQFSCVVDALVHHEHVGHPKNEPPPPTLLLEALVHACMPRHKSKLNNVDVIRRALHAAPFHAGVVKTPTDYRLQSIVQTVPTMYTTVIKKSPTKGQVVVGLY